MLSWFEALISPVLIMSEGLEGSVIGNKILPELSPISET